MTQVVKAQQAGPTAAASLPTAQPAAAAQLVAAHQEVAAAAAPPQAVNDDAWLGKRYIVPAHALEDTIEHISNRHLWPETVP